MTWVLGSGVTWGYGALVGDVRAVWSNGAHLDCLQKIHPVGSWLMAGFSGSVQFGFETIADLRRRFGSAATGYSYMPTAAAWRWHRRARRAFANAPTEIREMGCQVLLVGVSPLPHQGIPRAYCLRMRSPTFTPEVAPAFAWLSIGTGTGFDFASTCANLDMLKFADGVGKFEVMNRGGVAFTVGMIASMDSRKSPMNSVSSVFQVGTVWVGEHLIQTVDGGDVGGAWSKWSRLESQGLASSWEEFQEKARGVGLSPSAAAA